MVSFVLDFNNENQTFVSTSADYLCGHGGLCGRGLFVGLAGPAV
jgi:hypothetical protein